MEQISEGGRDLVMENFVEDRGDVVKGARVLDVLELI